jgi:adenylate cyclase
LTRDHRRLAAIVSADVAGYSRLMGVDDSGTLAALKAHRRELIDPKIAEYGGRIVKTTGDGLLLEFPSVVDAVRCAVDVQRGMAERNAALRPEQRIDLRIGINVGDIIIDGEDIHGDGVNVAARLQALAEPGGICASRVVRDQVLDKLSFTFEDLGAQQVKNIARPVEVYRVDLGSAETQTPIGNRRHWQRVTRALGGSWLAAAVVALGLAGIAAAWLLLPLLKPSPASADTPPPLSLAILPFAAASDSGNDRQYAEQLTNDLTTGVGRDRSATVAASSLASAYTGKTIDIPSVGRQLNARYIAEGEVRHVGEKLVVTVRLTDSKTRKQSWSDRREYDAAALAASPDAASLQLTRRLFNALLNAEIQRAASDAAPAGQLDLVLRGYAAQNAEPGVNGPREARKRFEAALRLDPNSVPALAAAANSYADELQFSPNPDHKLFEQKMDALTGRAVSIDPNDADAWYARAQALSWLGRWDEALSAIERAEGLKPWAAGILVYHSWIMISTSRPADALVAAQRAAAIDPPGGGGPQLLICKGYLYLGRYEDAVKACEKSAGLNNSWIDQVYLTAAYAQNGDLNKAKIARDELLKLQPGYTIERYRETWYSGTPAFFDLVEKHLAAGLRKAGIPEK